VKLAETPGRSRHVEEPEGQTFFGKARAPALVGPAGAVGPEIVATDLRVELSGEGGRAVVHVLHASRLLLLLAGAKLTGIGELQVRSRYFDARRSNWPIWLNCEEMTLRVSEV
jgi:hypothetical protein